MGDQKTVQFRITWKYKEMNKNDEDIQNNSNVREYVVFVFFQRKHS